MVGEGEAEGVGFGERQWRWGGHSGVAAAQDAFGAGADKHSVGKVGAEDAGFAFGAFAEGEREIAGATAEIEDERVFALEDGAKQLGGAGAPETIELEREDVVEGVVTGGDLGEHFADFAGGVGFGLGAFGLGAFGGRGASGHGL